MNATVEDLRGTVIPKSDQLNADQLVSGPMDVIVTDVRMGSADQPVIVHYEQESGRPFKPCKTMRRVLILAWGENGKAWIGRSMRLYHAPEVKFGGETVGGVRISHLTDIPKTIRVSLSHAKGKKSMHEIHPMPHPSDVGSAIQAIEQAADIDALKAAFAAGLKSTKDSAAKGRLKVASDLRKAALNLASFIERINAAESSEAAEAVVEEARGMLPAEHMPETMAAFRGKWEGSWGDDTSATDGGEA